MRVKSKYSKRGLFGFKVEYAAWLNAKGRCNNPTHSQYHNYGGRGISMCDKWLNDFDAFIDHIGSKPYQELTLERIDNDRGYEPGNVKWETRGLQIHNRRAFNRNNVKRIILNGECKTLTEWANKTGIRRGVLAARIKTGWLITDLFKPVNYKRPNRPKSDK